MEEEILLGELTDGGFSDIREENEAAILDSEILQKWNKISRERLIKDGDKVKKVACHRCWQLENKKGLNESDNYADYEHMELINIDTKKEFLKVGGKIISVIETKQFDFKCPQCGAGNTFNISTEGGE